MLPIGLAVAQVVVTTLAAGAVGGWILGSRLSFPHGALRWSAQAAAGFLAISHAIYLLQLFGLARAAPLRLLYAGLGVIAAVKMMSLGSSAARTAVLRRDVGSASTRQWPGVTGWLIGTVAVVYVVWMVLCATSPAVAVDELIHHLAVPRRTLDAGGTFIFQDNIYAYFPALGEMLFLFGLEVSGEVAARLFHTVFGLSTAIALFGFSRRYLPVSGAVWAVAIFLSVPSVMVIFPWAYVDLIFTLYALVALAALVEFFDSGQMKWVVVAGVMAGGALATKYTGLQLIMLLALLALVEHLRAGSKRVPGESLVLGVVAVLTAAPYLWRNWRLTGWPLFPFEFGPFALRPEINWDTDRAAMFLTMLASYGRGDGGVGPASWWDSVVASMLVFLGARFNDPRWYDGVVGPVFLLAPVLLWRRVPDARIRTLAVYSVMFLAYWSLTIRQARFLIPILPIFALLLAVGLHLRRSRLAYAIVGVGVAVSVAVAVGRVVNEGPLHVWSGAEPRDAYLRRRLAVFEIYQEANRRLGPHDRLYLINMRNFGYYLRPDWRADFVFEAYQLEKLLAVSGDPRELSRFFAVRGITHVLIDERITFSPAVFSAHQRATLEGFLKERATLLQAIDLRTLYRLHE